MLLLASYKLVCGSVVDCWRTIYFNVGCNKMQQIVTIALKIINNLNPFFLKAFKICISGWSNEA